MVQGESPLPAKHKQIPAAVRILQPTVVVSRALHSAGIHGVKGFYDNGYVQDRLCPDAVDGGTAEMLNIHHRFVPERLNPRPDCQKFVVPTLVVRHQPDLVSFYSLHGGVLPFSWNRGDITAF